MEWTAKSSLCLLLWCGSRSDFSLLIPRVTPGKCHVVFILLWTHVCCELLHHVDLVCCTLSQTSMNCQQLVYQVHVTAFVSTHIQVDSLLNCSCIYCIKLYVLKLWGIGSLQFLCTFLHVCDISSLCKETGKWMLCCTSCASWFCTCVCMYVCVHVHVQANLPIIERRCPCCTDLDLHGLLWIPLQLSSPSTCTIVGSSNLCCCWALWGGWLQAYGLQGNVAVGLKQYCVPVASVSTKI